MHDIVFCIKSIYSLLSLLPLSYSRLTSSLTWMTQQLSKLYIPPFLFPSNPFATQKQMILKQKLTFKIDVRFQLTSPQWLPIAFKIKCPTKQPAIPYITTPAHHFSRVSPLFSILSPYSAAVTLAPFQFQELPGSSYF